MQLSPSALRTGAVTASRKRPETRLRIAIALIFIAFFQQSYVTQTHIHGAAAASAATHLAKQMIGPDANAGGVQTSPSHTPLSDDSADCPLCQAVNHAGAFYVPILLVLCFAAVLQVYVPFASVPNLRTAHLSHSHTQRGPPRI